MLKDLMLKDPITVLAHAVVRGPDGRKTRAGKFYTYEDGPYLRILLKSDSVTLVDPPSLDPEYLEKAGYQLREGYSYPEKVETKEQPVVETPVAAEVVKEVPAKTAPQKVTPKKTYSKEEPKKEVSKSPVSKGDHAPQNLQLTPPIGMGVKSSEEE
jgi:hypothetical protein